MFAFHHQVVTGPRCRNLVFGQNKFSLGADTAVPGSSGPRAVTEGIFQRTESSTWGALTGDERMRKSGLEIWDLPRE